jgi:hypothetical protein
MLENSTFKPRTEVISESIENLPPEEVFVDEIRAMDENTYSLMARFLKKMEMTRTQAELYAREWRKRSVAMRWGTDGYQDFLGVPSALLEKKTYIPEN